MFESWLFDDILIVRKFVEDEGTADGESSFRKMFLSFTMPAPLLKLSSIDGILGKKFAISMIIIMMQSSLIFLMLLENLKDALFFSLLELSLIDDIIQKIDLGSCSMFFFLTHLSIIHFAYWWKYQQSLMLTCFANLFTIVCTISILFDQGYLESYFILLVEILQFFV